jgi:Glycosyl hydrolase family 1
MKSGWHVLDPEVMYWAPRQVQSIWGATSSYITENGCAADDVVADDGRVYDTDRVMFMRACLGQLQRATAEGVPVDGYFYWSSQDNLDWNAGFGNRFGIVYVDFETLARTPKLSAEWFREAARHNAVVEARMARCPDGTAKVKGTSIELHPPLHPALLTEVRDGRGEHRSPGSAACEHPVWRVRPVPG